MRSSLPRTCRAVPTTRSSWTTFTVTSAVAVSCPPLATVSRRTAGPPLVWATGAARVVGVPVMVSGTETVGLAAAASERFTVGPLTWDHAYVTPAVEPLPSRVVLPPRVTLAWAAVALAVRAAGGFVVPPPVPVSGVVHVPSGFSVAAGSGQVVASPGGAVGAVGVADPSVTVTG